MTTEMTQVRNSRGAGLMLASIPLVLLITHYLTVIPHEFTHSILAWALGIKENPWLIDWGGDSLLNILLLVHINENVDYHNALDAGKTLTVAVVALSGPLLANGGMYLIFRKLSTTAWVKARPFASWIVLWLIVVNLGNLWCYIPIRAFAADGDFRHFIWATGASPWLLYVVVGYFVLWGLVDFYRRALPSALEASGLLATWARATVLVVSTGVIFAYFAIPGFLETDAVSLFIAGTSVLAIPPVLIATWRRVVSGSAACAAIDDGRQNTSDDGDLIRR